jgi:hypothetical protein
MDIFICISVFAVIVGVALQLKKNNANHDMSCMCDRCCKAIV